MCMLVIIMLPGHLAQDSLNKKRCKLCIYI